MKLERTDDTAIRTTSLLFAAAFCALVVSILVVQRSSAALSSEAASEATIEAGRLDLTDDDAGRSLIDVSGLAPGRPVAECIRVSYGGDIVPVEVRLQPSGSGPLAAHLLLTVERGRGGTFGECARFEPEVVVAQGRLDELSGGWFKAGNLVETPNALSYRVTVEVSDDNAAQGLTTGLELLWEASPR